ncbi:MAG TPA: hypothetical protein VFN88_08710 [Caulobacteraceae bacterium]|nr:hypothetical protein [Caulobacteraceae bacterium]
MPKLQATWLAGFGAALAIAGPAVAGPPYVTDDPEPTDLHRWEIYAFTGGSHARGLTGGAGGLDLNYGAAKDLQLTAVIPSEYESDGGFHAGWGDVELAAKIKFLHQDRFGADVAFFPRIFLPTAPSHGEARRVSVLLPVWIGKDVGAWTLFGGGGYTINPGAGARDYWQAGIAATHDLGAHWNVGGELYWLGADAVGGKDFASINLGVSYKLTEHWSLLAAGGPGVRNARENGRYDYYLSLKLDY